MKNVLLVDDDVVFTFLNKRIISALDFVNEIDVAQNGLQAIELLGKLVKGSNRLHDIILLDLNMPIMDGFGFLEAFKRADLPNKEQVKIIILTSSIHPEDIQRAKNYGVTSYLTKPLREEGLLAEISKP
ncbi:MAG TPA: response regulator [Chryseosolibacter sp.]